MFVVCKDIVHVHMEECVKIWQREMIHYIVRTQPAGDTSEETVRSIMKVHRCHRLHTKKGREGNAFISKCLPSIRSPMHAKRCLSS